ncbi:PP2C family protein-serine/threonine phosphatase [Sanguibacter sp. Z1732]|uniref:PP2C family protein-serine/threonine phosphatase n=1 Tax=Sanguibacter sp. Z1732 TaxID=3435412 RepID=UPI003D9CB469
MSLPDDAVVLVIGDVAGHDIEAAAAMGQLRSVVRAFAADLHDPGEVLSRVDRIVDSMRIGRVASLTYSILTPIDGGGDWELRYSRAGHLPGLLISDGEVRQLDGAGGRLVGFGATTRQSATERLRPGDVLVLYTDGLVERRDRPAAAPGPGCTDRGARSGRGPRCGDGRGTPRSRTRRIPRG